MCPRVPPQIAAAMTSCHIEASLTVTSRNLDLKLRFKFRQRLEPNQSLTLTPPPTRPFRRFPIMSFHMSLELVDSRKGLSARGTDALRFREVDLLVFGQV